MSPPLVLPEIELSALRSPKKSVPFVVREIENGTFGVFAVSDSDAFRLSSDLDALVVLARPHRLDEVAVLHWELK